LAKQFQSGIATPQLTKARAYLQALHMSNDDIDTALSSAQQFNKLSFQQILQNVKKFEGSRPAMQIMLKTFELATQNESLSPQTNHKLIGGSPGAADYAQKYNEDWSAAQSKGRQNEDKFRTDWEKANNLDDFKEAAWWRIGNFKGEQLPDPGRMVQGARYVALRGHASGRAPPRLSLQLQHPSRSAAYRSSTNTGAARRPKDVACDAC
jgi:hypothetical protein